MTRLTVDITDDDIHALGAMCASVGADPLDMASVAMSESGFRPDAHNRNGDASGVWQMMPATLHGLGGGDIAAFRALSIAEQMPWWGRYYAPAKGRLASATACYLWTFLPARIGHATEPNYVLAAKGDERTGAVFSANAGFDRDGDLRIEVRELGLAIVRACVAAPRWTELEARITDVLVLSSGLGSVAPSPLPADDLRTWRGIQIALVRAGLLRGADVDGVVGPRTLFAVRVFQSARGLVVDGVVGPRTRAALGRV